MPTNVTDRRNRRGSIDDVLDTIEGGEGVLLYKGKNRTVSASRLTARLIGSPSVKREARSVSRTLIKPIFEADDVPDNEDEYGRLSIDLTKDLPVSLFAKPPIRMPILKATNYYV